MMAARSQNTRGRGRGGRGGRGFNRRANGNDADKKVSEKKLKKFSPMVKGKAPEFSFDEVKKELVKALELTSMEKADDVINSVRNMQLVDLDGERPKLKVSTLEGDAAEVEKEQFKEDYKYDMKKWDRRVDALDDNKRKLHAKILKFCSESMEEKLNRESDIDTVLHDDPIALLKRIQKFMTTSEDTDWEYFQLWEALKRLVNCHQGGNEAPNAFRRRICSS